MDTSVEDFITLTRQAKTVDELFFVFKRQMENYGFKRIAYAIISDHPSLNAGNPAGLLLKNNLNQWDEHYLENGYIDIDLSTKITSTIPGFFTWSDMILLPDITKAQRDIFQQAEEFKLYNGINISIHVAGGVKCVFVMASDQQNILLNDYIKDKISLVSHQFNTCFLSLMNHKVEMSQLSRLSIKEEDILKWSAKGLTKTEISQQLNISHHTVNYHMRSIFKKLDAKNTTEALIIAIKQGLTI